MREIRILLAEDDSINRVVAAKLLSVFGCPQVDLAANSLEALEKIEENHYDIVLMDIDMPVMDGIEAARRIRDLPGRNSEIPIVALTAYAMKGDREKLLDAGMDEYVAKPLEKEDLRRALDAVLGTRQAPRVVSMRDYVSRKPASA